MSVAKSVSNQAEIELLTPTRLLSQAQSNPQRTRSKPKATFNLKPTYFHIPKERSSLEESTTNMDQEFVMIENGMSPAQIQAIKDQNQKKIKRIVAIVGITLTIISIILVGLSLSFGQKIDEIGELLFSWDELFI